MGRPGRPKKKKIVFGARRRNDEPVVEDNTKKKTRKNFTELEKLEGLHYEHVKRLKRQPLEPSPAAAVTSLVPLPTAAAPSLSPLPPAAVTATSGRYPEANAGNLIIHFPTLESGIRDNLCCRKCAEEAEEKTLENFVSFIERNRHFSIREALNVFKMRISKKKRKKNTNQPYLGYSWPRNPSTMSM